MKLNVTFEILFLVLIASLNRRVAGQSLLSLDLHKQSQRTKPPPSLGALAALDKKPFGSPETSAESSADSMVAVTSANGLSDRLSLVQASAPGASATSGDEAQEAPATTPMPSQSSDTRNAAAASKPATRESSPNYAELNSATELCYLANGGSSLTLTVNEATPVGAPIGTIDVNGDPALEGGNVDLQVLESGGGGGETVDHAGRQLNAQAAIGASSPAGARQVRRLLGRRDVAGAPLYSLEATSQLAPPPLAALGPALRLEPGGKELLLARPLDKESVEGESSLVVNVRCRPRAPPPPPLPASASAELRQARRLPAAPATTIPIRLIITDANDHAPEFVGAQPYVISFSETTAANSALGGARDIQALDRDSAGPHSTIHYHVLEHSGAPLDSAQAGTANWSHLAHHFAFNNPLEPVLWLTSPLDYDTLPASSFAITIVAQDQAEPEPLQTRAQVHINVLDFDDQNPRFLDEKYTLVMDEQQAGSVGQRLRVLPRDLRAEDGDRGIMAPILYAFDSQTSASSSSESPEELQAGELPPVEAYLHLNPTSGELRLIRQWPAAAKWPGGAGAPLTLVVRATQADNRDRYALTTLTIARAGANASSPAQVAQSHRGGGTAKAGQAANKVEERGIAFEQERVFAEAPEDVAVNSRLVSVRARHLGAGGDASVTQAAGDFIKQDRALNGTSQVAKAAPISYQLLDDQMDQFGITQTGEVYLKRPLDYERRQEFKLRVLATHAKHSDICHLHLRVLNVNDNKPKFTQSQYSFHLTEARLRANQLGAVQAHDADLNDTISYSLLTPSAGSAPGANQVGQQQSCAHLFEFAEPTSGRLSLRPTGTGQLNASQCQLLVQATDSLGPPAGRHQQQARVNVLVANQLLGRPLGPLLQAPGAGSRAPNPTTEAAGAATNGRQRGRQLSPALASALDHFQVLGGGAGAGDSATSSSVIVQYQQQPGQPQPQPQPPGQRSSLATVMASLQHMVKGVNFFEMPLSSALLLSVLLAFLVCLLLIVLVSMSVHVYRRSSKARRRRHLAAAAHLRHAHHLASGGSPGALMSPYSLKSTAAASHQTTSPSSYTATTSPSSSPASSSGPSEPVRDGRSGRAPKQGYLQTNLMATSSGAPAMLEAAQRNNSNEASSNNTTINETSGGGGGDSSKRRASQQQLEKPAGRPLEEPLKISTSEASLSGCDKAVQAAGTYVKSSGRPALNSLVSSLTITSNQNSCLNGESSILTTDDDDDDDDDSSALHCGHYSVNGTITSRRQVAAAAAGDGRAPAQARPEASSQRSGGGGGGTSRLLDEMKFGLGERNGAAPQNSAEGPKPSRSSIEAAIRSLVRQEADNDDDHNEQADAGRPLAAGHLLAARKAVQLPGGRFCATSELAELTACKPGVKAYRKLPLMNSLVRPVRSQLAAALAGSTARVAPQAGGGKELAAAAAAAAAERAGLMALVRESCAPGGKAAAASEQAPQIRWPSGALPPRGAKRLTWDDELACVGTSTSADEASLERREKRCSAAYAAADCYIAPDVHLNGPMAPLSPEHHYSSPARLPTAAREPQQFLYAGGNQSHAPPPPPSGGGHFRQQTGAAADNRNNCLDYTIVQTSQFHADSLSNSISAAVARASAANFANANKARRSMGPDEERDYLYSTTATNHSSNSNNNLHANAQNCAADDDDGQQQREHYYYEQSLGAAEPLENCGGGGGAGSQMESTYKLNQNYQDLKLMTTAVL